MTEPFAGIYRGKKVFLTGHTGFKGSWMAEWLCKLGAEVVGLSHEIPEGTSLFRQLKLEQRMTHIIGDVRDGETLLGAIDAAKPDFVFHLAAQSLVRYSYDHPIETFATNVMGTANLLEALRVLGRPAACVVVTSDKCYENREVLTGYREDDALGGKDPYSASKGAAEIVTHSYLRSYFSAADTNIRLASARSGNVIGGGDWAEDRIVPDCIRHLTNNETIGVRNPAATRPWQHVLEATSGYLWLGAVLTGKVATPRVKDPIDVSEGFNFGPWVNANVPVGLLVDELLKHWPGRWEKISDDQEKPEASLLGLSIDKAFHKLNWQPTMTFVENVQMTASWYRNVLQENVSAKEQTDADIRNYIEKSRNKAISWACT